jgi:hypothetical protein
MIYGMSVFWLPLTHAIGTACEADMGFIATLTATSCDWTVPNLVAAFEIGIVFLGASAAIWGGWLERVGPRRAGVVATLCWPSGLVVTAGGVYLHQLWIVWLRMGALGGVGLGIGGSKTSVMFDACRASSHSFMDQAFLLRPDSPRSIYLTL